MRVKTLMVLERFEVGKISYRRPSETAEFRSLPGRATNQKYVVGKLQFRYLQ